MGFVLASRRPANRIGWLALAAGLALAAEHLLGPAYGAARPDRSARVAARGPGRRVAVQLDLGDPAAALAFVFLLFPDRAAALPAVAPGRVVRGRCLRADRGCRAGGRDPRLVAPVHLLQSGSGPAGADRDLVLVPAALLVSVAAVVVRFALSSGEERLQLKWFAAAALLVVATLIPSILTSSAVATVLAEPGVPVPGRGHRHRGAEVPAVRDRHRDQQGRPVRLAGRVHHRRLRRPGRRAWGRWSATGTARCCRRWPPRWWRSRSSRSGSGPGGWPTGWCTAGGPPRTRCCPTSPGASAARTPDEDVLPQMAQIVAAGTGAEQVVVWLRVDDELRPEASSDGSPDCRCRAAGRRAGDAAAARTRT